MDGILVLYNESFTDDELLQRVPTVTERPCIASVSSVTRAEWIAAGHNNLKPSFVARTAAINYHGENKARFGGKVYSIYRTYIDDKSDDIELYLEEEAGMA